MGGDGKLVYREHYPAALTVAGSDSGGGAGVQADLRTFNAFGVYACSAVCAVTSQNPFEVSHIETLSPGSVRSQLEAVLSAYDIKAVKTGMLGDGRIVSAVSSALDKAGLGNIVVDPVLSATSGAELSNTGALNAMRDDLLHRAAWITPNISEAELLSGTEISDMNTMNEAARRIAEKWNSSILLKGGHSDDPDKAVDIVFHKAQAWKLISPRVDSGYSHGSGCTLSAALAASLALGFPWKEALCAAKAFVYGSLVESVSPGDGFEAMYPPSENYLNKILLRKL